MGGIVAVSLVSVARWLGAAGPARVRPGGEDARGAGALRHG